MEEKTTQLIAQWAERTGKPKEELTETLVNHIALYRSTIPNKDDKYYEEMARRKLYLEIKGELTSPAKPYDFVFLGKSGTIDVTAKERDEKSALWANLETRAQAVAEGKLSEGMSIGGKPVPDGTPLDTREWMVAPDDAGEGGRKNRRFGKPLIPFLLRAVVGFGRPAKGGEMRLIAATAMNEQTKDELFPADLSTVRARLNLRDDKQPAKYVLNTSTRTEYTPIEMSEYPGGAISMEQAANILLKSPLPIHPVLSELMAWHRNNEKDPRRIVVFEGDVTRLNREPTAYGSYLIVIEDASAMDLEAEGTPVWLNTPPNFGIGSKVVGIGRTNIGPGFNRETGQLDSSIERVQLNASCVFAIPAFRVPPEEESVIEGEVVQ